MFTSRMLISTALCATAVVGLAGMNGYVSGEGDGATVNSETLIETTVSTNADADGTGSSRRPVTVEIASVEELWTEELGVGSDSTVLSKTTTNGGPRFKPYAADARPVERWMYEMLEQPVPKLDFPGDTPLKEVLEALSMHYTKTYGTTDDGELRLTIWQDKAEFELEGITSLDDITINDVNFEGITLQNALDLIFEQTIEPELTYEIKNEVLYITTLAKAESDEGLVTRVYDVDHLLALDYADGVFSARGGGGFGGGGGGGFFSVVPQDATQTGGMARDNGQLTKPQQSLPVTYTLAELVQEMTSPPCRWLASAGEGGAIKIVGRSLVVRQTQAGHREIVRLLNLLTESIGAIR